MLVVKTRSLMSLSLDIASISQTLSVHNYVMLSVQANPNPMSTRDCEFDRIDDRPSRRIAMLPNITLFCVRTSGPI